jgi:23S rRNA-/tRNA-specific pseudouridylate synthase
MVYLSNLQKETLLLVDKMINENKTYEEICNYLYKNDYTFRVEVKNGYASKTKFEIVKMIKDKNGNIKEEYTFVDLIKRRNGLAYWETIKLS